DQLVAAAPAGVDHRRPGRAGRAAVRAGGCARPAPPPARVSGAGVRGRRRRRDPRRDRRAGRAAARVSRRTARRARPVSRRAAVAAGGPREPFALDVAAEPAALPALAACWAREQLLALEDRFAARAGDRDEIAAEIVRTSLRFGVLCRFTAFVAVDEHGPIAR